MAKMNITVDKSFGVLKAKAAMREEVAAVILEALRAHYGEDAAAMVRVVSEATARGENLVGAVVADIAEDGGVFDGAVTIKITAKDWTDRVGTKAVKPAWDFTSAAEAYTAWESETEAKNAEKAAAKKAKMEADAAARAKRKAEADARKAAK